MLPLAGSMTGRVLSVGTVSIHGDVYLDLLVQVEEKPEAVRMRVPVHALRGGRQPRAGDRVAVESLLGQVTGARVIE